MTRHRFHKMHGIGNDFVVFDARETPLELDGDAVRALADRHVGIGCDQLIVLQPSDKADLAMQIFNADGGDVEACGNATRCVIALLGKPVTIETAGGLLSGRPEGNDRARAAEVDMGAPRFGWNEIPLAYAMDTAALPVGWENLDNPVAVNIGNPHIVFFVEDADEVSLHEIGPMIETDPLFPSKVNVNVAHVRNGEIHLRVWERGTGLTMACGSGACATAVAAIRRKLVTSPVTVHLPGGPLVIGWREGESVSMTGPASHVFEGEIEISQ